MNVSTPFIYTTLDYLFGIYEIGSELISTMIWICCNTLICGIVPLTFSITINNFEEVVHNLVSENDTSVLSVCRLFDQLKNMSKYINSNWGILCLIWTVSMSTAHIFEIKTWILSTDYVLVMYYINELVSLTFILYLSGDAYCKVR